MKVVSIILALIAAGVGLRAAYLWYRASQVIPVPLWQVEPGDTQLSQMGWLAAEMEATRQSGVFNRAAAIWTAWSVVLGAVSAILDNWHYLLAL